MSIEAVMSRVSQLQAMLASANGAPAAAAATATSKNFSTELANATATHRSSPAAATPASTAATAATATVSELPSGTPYASEITAAAKANGLDPALLAGLIKQESGFNPTAGSPAGARGLAQLMPATAAGLGVTNVLDPVQSINGGAKYLAQQLKTFGGDVAKALAAYNAGPGAVQRFGGIPPYAETQNYVRIVQANAATYRAGATVLQQHSVLLRRERSLRDLRPMTTDRTAAPTRGTALADRAAHGARTQAPPADAFSALLAAAPKSDAPARRDERPLRRDEPQRWDEGPRQRLERRPNGPKHDEYRRPDAATKEAAPTEDIATSCDPEEPTTEEPVTVATPSLFALQLASPLPPATGTRRHASRPPPRPRRPRARPRCRSSPASSPPLWPRPRRSHPSRARSPPSPPLPLPPPPLSPRARSPRF